MLLIILVIKKYRVLKNIINDVVVSVILIGKVNLDYV